MLLLQFQARGTLVDLTVASTALLTGEFIILSLYYFDE